MPVLPPVGSFNELSGRLILAISSRALFDLEEGHAVYAEEGVEAYARYQRSRESDRLGKGVAYPLVQKLLRLNDAPPVRSRVEVILVSRNSADTGLRIFNSIEEHGLGISRAVFTGGRSPYPYIRSFGAHLFLSADADDVVGALEAGSAAAAIFPASPSETHTDELRIAFDGDSVLFSDDSERVYRTQGLVAFTEGERRKSHEPLEDGPFKGFLASLRALIMEFPTEYPLVRTALMTARGAPAHERVIRTLRNWDIPIDEVFFLGGLNKAPFLKEFGADIFFDDHRGHCDLAADVVPTGHVPHGVNNLERSQSPTLESDIREKREGIEGSVIPVSSC